MTVQDAPAPTAATGVPAARRARGQVETYDFRRPLTLVREHARHLEMAFERFARQFGNQLTARLRVMSNLTFDQVALHTYDEYVNRLPSPTAMVLCTLESSRQTAVVQLPVGATMVWIDYLFGGNGRGDEREGRELTEIELTLVRDLLQHSLGDLEYAFAGLTRLVVSVQGVQYNPQFVQAAAASETVLVASFTLRVGEREDAVTLMLPADTMLAALNAVDGASAQSDDERLAAALAHADLEHAVEGVPVRVGVQFAPRTVQPRDVLSLQVGDVLTLSHPSSTPLDVVVDGVVLAQAAIGSHGSRLACRVVTVEENPA
ncbi:flagellar motor switch protein FliM [Cellulomonas edaphi]|uniref:Flagellar motor switch protein FliM n=1 Tax=Cellulomonas edaphi TaxID=3053468 RepID=A0ABT7S4P3_9CELL|nr:flagellar motor switch protein FliM [Cellulomons edaphi]MDM7830556.1 flagellar motor switch protein FliM [Cellulomons edaphi]